jgi:hypothetical protein
LLWFALENQQIIEANAIRVDVWDGETRGLQAVLQQSERAKKQGKTDPQYPNVAMEKIPINGGLNGKTGKLV